MNFLQVRDLIKKGQLEIVIGSWTVPDEANSHYFALVDQMIEGHQWLVNEVGVKPNNTWSLDPFGYSSTLPYLYKRAGYKNMVILRVNEHVKKRLEEKQANEFFWRQHWDKKGTTDIFTQMMPYKLYNIKHTCGPDTHICLLFDFRRIPGEMSESRSEPVTARNVERLSKLLLTQYQKKAALFKHNVVLIPLGDDFRYDRIIEWDQQYENYRMLFDYMNNKPEWNVQARFGTLQDYFNEVQKEISSKEFPVVSGDFYPYTDQNNEYWSGYFTTRPFDKNMGRELESHLRGANIMFTLAAAEASRRGVRLPDSASSLLTLQEAHRSLGLFQHHDAITGTARSYVAVDYEDRLIDAIESAQTILKTSAEFILAPNREPVPKMKLDIDDPFSLRPVVSKRKHLTIEGSGSQVVFYNPLAQKRIQTVQVIIDTDKVGVLDHEGKVVVSQLNPVFSSDTTINGKRFELAFVVILPPLGMRSYVIRPLTVMDGSGNTAASVTMYNADNYINPAGMRFEFLPPGREKIILENSKYRVRFSPRTGLMHSVLTKTKIQTTKVNLQFLMYMSRGSGAYIFYPMGPAVDNDLSNRPVIRVVKGPIVSEIHVIQKLVQHTVKLHSVDGPMASAIEIDNVVDIRSMNDREMVMRLSTDVEDTNSSFYTDLNSLHNVHRKLHSNFPVQANYYPMGAMAYIQDSGTRVSLLTGQPLGVSAIEKDKGVLEVMLDRRLLNDDERGLGEGIMDNKPTPSRFYLVVEHPNQRVAGLNKAQITSHSSLVVSTLTHHLQYPVFTLMTGNGTASLPPVFFTPMKDSLPCDVHLVNLRPLKGTSTSHQDVAVLLHRTSMDCNLPAPPDATCELKKGQVQLGTIFPNAKVQSVLESSLSVLHDLRKTDLNETQNLSPMEIHCFKLTFQ